MEWEIANNDNNHLFLISCLVPLYFFISRDIKMQYIRLTHGDEFTKTLSRRVDEYFKQNKIRKTGNWKLLLKVPFMFSLFLLPYFLMIFGFVENDWLMMLMTVIMGIGMAGIGLSIMHDANHGVFSKYSWLNRLMSFSMEFLGGFNLNWRIQHNVLHHSFTNVHDMDEDIDSISLLRFSTDNPRKKIHRFQAYYAWFFYGFMTLSWMTNKDFMQLARYKKKGLIQAQRTTYQKALLTLIFTKTLYYFYMIAIPMLVMDVHWWEVLIGFFIMHFVCGIILAFVFQVAHVMPETELMNKDTAVELNEDKSWAKHQLMTTSNFENWNSALTWFVGGLNFQIEHHLFPDVSHIHYPKISKIVRNTAKEFGVQYNSHKTFLAAIGNHLRLLKQLGRA